ncbi:MAG: FHA domain-containing protein [Desulfobacterales bacterium]|nr:MAG: FHA domain-containing protein [Desulfobacterales bacterium]
MVRALLNRVKKRIKGADNFSENSPSSAGSTIGPLSSMLGPSGRITLASLKWFMNESGRDDFIEFVQNPVLAGSALNKESIAALEHPDDELADKTQMIKINKTQLVNLDDHLSKRSGPGASLPYAIYPLMKRPDSESPANIFTIGRTRNKDMSMKDMAISKAHAVIRMSKGSFFLEDCGSTNGTKLNGRRLADQPVLLHDKDVIALGNYEFTFLYPSSLHDLLSKL